MSTHGNKRQFSRGEEPFKTMGVGVLSFEEICDRLRLALGEDTDNMHEVEDMLGYDTQKLNLGEIEEVASRGGEGEGEDYHHVWHFKDHDVYLMLSGWYQSYHGTDYDGWDSVSQVFPKKKTVTVYVDGSGDQVAQGD